MVGSLPHFVGNCNGGVVFFQAVCIYLKKKETALQPTPQSSLFTWLFGIIPKVVELLLGATPILVHLDKGFQEN